MLCRSLFDGARCGVIRVAQPKLLHAFASILLTASSCPILMRGCRLGLHIDDARLDRLGSVANISNQCCERADLVRRLRHHKGVTWRQSDGAAVSCEEKLKMLDENLAEIRQMCQDAFEDALLMGCDEAQVRHVFASVITSLHNPHDE